MVVPISGARSQSKAGRVSAASSRAATRPCGALAIRLIQALRGLGASGVSFISTRLRSPIILYRPYHIRGNATEKFRETCVTHPARPRSGKPSRRPCATISAEGRYRPGDKLPTEAALAERFGVNRHTVRHGLSALVEEGLLRTRRGAGAFVAARPTDYPIGARVRFHENLIAAGRRPEKRGLHLAERAATQGEARRRSGDDDIRVDIPRDDRAVPERHLGPDHRAPADPAVMADTGDARFAVREEGIVAPGIVPVIVRAVEEMVARDGVQRVIRRTDPRERRDIGELADPRIGDVGIAVAIGIVAEHRVRHAAAAADLDIGPDAAVGDLAVRVDDRPVGREPRHQDLRPMSLPRSQPESQSMAITIATISTM